MHVHPLRHVSLDDLPDESQRTLIELLNYVDLMADEAAHKATHAQDARRVAFYLGMEFALEMSREEITLALERLARPELE